MPVDFANIKMMNNRIRHRGPSGEGYHFGEHFALGHRRLSIIDLSDAGLQPFQRDQDYIIFNGMIYNYLEIRQQLIEEGFSFATETDTEVLLAACMRWGVNAFNKLNGMWAFAWFKSDTNEIILCRDRYGMKPLYYTEVKGLFAVGSEIKQFLDLPGFEPVLNYTSAVNFLCKGLLNYSEQTFFEGVKELRGGNYLVYNLDSHKYKIANWYNVANSITPQNVEEKQAVEKLLELFNDSVRLRMRADVKVGSCLSGGIDSSSIVSAIYSNKLANKDFATITSCYDDKKYDEQLYSDEVTTMTGFDALKVYPKLNQLFEGDLDKMLYHQDQPFSTASHYSEHQVFKTARINKFTVMLDGQGADEYLCGYEDFFPVHLRTLMQKFKFLSVIRDIRLKAKQENTSVLGVICKSFRSLYFYPLLSFLKPILGKSNTPWLHPSLRVLAEKKLEKFETDDVQNLSINQMSFSSLPYQLHSGDRNAMMFSIESRLPFLDHRLVEFVMSLPYELKIKNGYSKFILREAVKEMPEIIRKRTHKMGFVAPDEPWIKQNHAAVRNELIDTVMHTNIFDPALLERFDNFIAGKLNFEPIYFRAIALNRFIKIFKMRLQIPAVATGKFRVKNIESSFRRA